MMTFPQLNLLETRQMLEYIDGNMKDINDDDLSQQIKKLTIGLPFQTLKFQKGFLFRGRINEGRQLFKNVKDIGLPPLCCVRCNRFNDEKTQLLYVAELKSTVIEELRPMLGCYITLVTYMPLAQINVLPVGMLSGTTKTELFDAKYWQNLNDSKRKLFNNNAEYIQIDHTINEYLNKYLTTENKSGDPKEYRFTNIYGKHFFAAPIDGLLYPSITRKLYDVNIALRAEAAKKLRAIQIDVIKMDEHIPGKFEIVTGSNLFNENGDITYNNSIGSFTEMTRL